MLHLYKKNAAIAHNISTNNKTITVRGCNYPFCLISKSTQVNAISVRLTLLPSCLFNHTYRTKEEQFEALNWFEGYECALCCQNCVPNTWCMGLRIPLTCSIVPLQFFFIFALLFPFRLVLSGYLSTSQLAGLWWGGGDDGVCKLCELIASRFWCNREYTHCIGRHCSPASTNSWNPSETTIPASPF